MNDYFDKARNGRITALDFHQSGTVMFFPSDLHEVELTGRPVIRQEIAQTSKPMFLRSSTVEPDTGHHAVIHQGASGGPCMVA